MTSKRRFDLTAFGESLLRLSPPLGETLETAACFNVHIAGAEGNVLSALAQLGFSCGWSGALPNSPLGRRVRRAYQSCGVTVASVSDDDNRLGVYFLQSSPPPFASRVIYDRDNTAASHTKPTDLDWDFLLNTRALHLTGITPALSETCRASVETALTKAKERGILIGFDVNYRQLLWDAPTARKTLLPYLALSDLIFCSRQDAAKVFGCEGSGETVLTQLAKLTGVRQIVTTDGGNDVYGYQDGVVWASPTPAVTIVDRVGAGDAFAAGVWSGVLGGDFGAGINTGIALSARALTQVGDIVTVTAEDLAIPQSSNIVR